MSRKTVTSQDIVDLVEGIEDLVESARQFQTDLGAFVAKRTEFDERASSMNPVAFLSLAMSSLGARASLIAEAAALDVKSIKGAETALAAILSIGAGVTDFGSAPVAKQPAAKQPAVRQPVAPSALAAEGDGEVKSRAPKSPPDRFKNYSTGFRSGYEAGEAGNFDPAEADKKGWTSRGYKAGNALHLREPGKVAVTEADVLRPYIDDLVAFGDQEEAAKARQILAKALFTGEVKADEDTMVVSPAAAASVRGHDAGEEAAPDAAAEEAEGSEDEDFQSRFEAEGEEEVAEVAEGEKGPSTLVEGVVSPPISAGDVDRVHSEEDADAGFGDADWTEDQQGLEDTQDGQAQGEGIPEFLRR